jgi:hypothetical protein
MSEVTSDVPSLSLEDDRVQLRRSGELVWEVPVSEVRVIGEYTTEGGPWADDWFVLLVGKDGNWFEAPADVHNLGVVLTGLGERLQAPIAVALANSTSFRSRILWPPSLQGQQLLDFRPRRFRNWLLRLTRLRRTEYALTKAVVDTLE